MSSRSKLTSLNVSNTLTCVLQRMQLANANMLRKLATRTHMRIATLVFRSNTPYSLTGNPHSHAYCNLDTGCSHVQSLFDWQPALTCVLQRQKCTILQHAEFANARLFVHGYLLSLGLKKSRRVSTEYRSEKHFLLRILSAKIRVCIS